MAVRPGSGDNGTHGTYGVLMGTAEPGQSLLEEEMLGLGPGGVCQVGVGGSLGRGQQHM